MAGEWPKLPIRAAPPPPGHSGNIVSGDAGLRTIHSAESGNRADREPADSGSTYSDVEATNGDRAQERPSVPIGPGYSPSAGGEAATHPGHSPPPGLAYTGFKSSGEARLHAGDVCTKTPPPASAYSGFGAYDHGRLHAGNVNTTNYYYGSGHPGIDTPNGRRAYQEPSAPFGPGYSPHVDKEASAHSNYSPPPRSEFSRFGASGEARLHAGNVYNYYHGPDGPPNQNRPFAASPVFSYPLQPSTPAESNRPFESYESRRDGPAGRIHICDHSPQFKCQTDLDLIATSGCVRGLEQYIDSGSKKKALGIWRSRPTKKLWEWRGCYGAEGLERNGNILHFSAATGHFHMVEMLCGMTKNIFEYDSGVVKISNEDGSRYCTTALHLAARYGHEYVVEFLLKRAFGLRKDADGRTPLHYASRTPEMLDRLLTAGYNINEADSEGFTTLHHAVSAGATASVRFLLEHGATVDCRTLGLSTPLHFAVRESSDEIARLLVDRGADIEAKSKSGNTPLHDAIHHCATNCVRFLLEHGALANCRDEKFLTPLHYAAERGTPEIARLLLDRGAELEAKSTRGQTPLHNAALFGSVGMLQFLLDCGADIAPKKKDGVTPLHLSVYYRHIEAARLLLTHGADARIKDNNGRTPLQLAISLGLESNDKSFAPVVKLLQDREEDQKKTKGGAAKSRVGS